MLFHINFLLSLAKTTVRNYIISVFGLGYLKSDGKYIEIDYCDGEVNYTVRFLKKRGPSKIHSIKNSEGEDVTLEIKKYMGPCYNFHGIPTTPKDLGYRELTIEYIDDTTTIVEENTLLN